MKALVRFETDPLGWQDELVRSGLGAAVVKAGVVGIADAKLARAILRNDDGWFEDHSDFFGSGPSAFGPREAQIAVGRKGRDLALRHLRTIDIAAGLTTIDGAQSWPRAGNALLETLYSDALVGAHRASRFRRLRASILEARILGRERRQGTLRRSARRFAFYLAFERERGIKRAECEVPGDMLDLLFELGEGATTEKLLELYIAFNFALVGSLGFSLGWAIFLALRHDALKCEPRHILAETLRLYPVAWLLSRRAIRAHTIGGTDVSVGDEVWVLPYAVHRQRQHWHEPQRFDPDRWNEHPDRSAWMPFGAGEHTCAAVSLSFQTFEMIWRTMLKKYDLRITDVGAPSTIGPALAPPRFTLNMQRRPTL